MALRCSRWNECHCYNTVGCNGCGFQHFDRIEDIGNRAIQFLKEEYFNLCSKRRKGTGGRVAIDDAFKNLVLSEAKKILPGFPDLIALPVDNLTDFIEIEGQQHKFQLKCDGAFTFGNKYIFYEIKGYGDDTNSILSAITAAQFIGYGTKFLKRQYYYIGIGSPLAEAKKGLKREHFFLPKRVKIAPYIYWAENMGIIHFYGIRDVILLLTEIKRYCST
jgi:hypothetical protein